MRIEVKNKDIKKNAFLGWHEWNKYEVFGLFQRISGDEWWFNGPGRGVNFPADLDKSKMATEEEAKNLLENFNLL